MATFKAIIIEDEAHSRQLLKSIIQNFITEVSIINEADGIESGILAIQNERPDIVFLDIQLIDGSGFELLDAYGPIDFHLIFITAYNQHAIRAFKYSAFDYLLKPININKLEECIARLLERQDKELQNLDFLKANLSLSDLPPDRISINLTEGRKILKFAEITAVKSTNNYVFFIMDNGTKHLVSKTLSYYEDILPKSIFYRIHKSHFINIQKISEVTAGRASHVIMTDGSQYDIAARRKTIFLDSLKNSE